MNHVAATTTLSRLLLSLVVAFLLGVMLVPDVAAEKNTGRKPSSIAARVKGEKTRCESKGGKIQVTYTLPGADSGTATSTCTGGAHDGRGCTHTKKSTVCTQASTQPPQLPLTDVGEPPIDGGNEDSSGGNPPWQHALPDDLPILAADPGGAVGGEVVLTSYDGDKHGKAKHDGKRKLPRHGNRSR